MNLLKDVVRHLRQGAVARTRLALANPGARVALDLKILGDVSRIHLGTGVTVTGPGVLSADDGGGLSGSLLQIGARTYVGEFANIRCAGAPIRIGSDVLIAQNVSLIGTGHRIDPGELIGAQPWEGEGIEIGDGAWIAAGVTVLPGVRVGAGAVVGAGSVVTKDVPAGAIVAGVPARLVRMREQTSSEDTDAR